MAKANDTVKYDGLTAAERIKNRRKEKKKPFFARKKKERVIAVVDAEPKKKRSKKAEEEENSVKQTEKDLEAQALQEKEKSEKRVRVGGFMARMFRILLAASCIYLIFLIYGVLMTDFVYNNKGEVVPQVLSVDDISEKKKFQLILAQYEKCRMLYEDTIMIDYRLRQGIEDPLLLATEYEKLIKDPSVQNNMENLYKKTGAMVIDTKYTQIKELMLAWLDDEGNYLGNMSSAITNNDADAQNTALAFRDSAYDRFYMLTQNIVSLGDGIPGIQMDDVREWSPDGYLEEQINGTGKTP